MLSQSTSKLRVPCLDQDSNLTFDEGKSIDHQTVKSELKVAMEMQQIRRDQTRAIWKSMQHIDGLNIKSQKLQQLIDQSLIDSKIFQALLSIRILDDPSKHKSWLRAYNGELHDLPTNFIQALNMSAPQKFKARVADFNDNLFYDIQEKYGLKHLSNEETKQNKAINPDKILHSIIDYKQVLGSYLATESTTPQPPHVDFTWERLREFGQDLRLGFFPLTKDGMFLQVWLRNDDVKQSDIKGEIIFIPYGTLLTLPADTIHGGGFRTTTMDDGNDNHGNLRFHLYISCNGTRLSKNQTTNKYTEPGDKTKELADRYTDAPMMNKLMECLFVS